MASYDQYKPVIGTKDYLTKYDGFVNASETVATEIENAREGALTLVANLQNNYAKYVLTSDIEGGAVSGTSTSGSTTALLHTGVDFVTLGIENGDTVVDLTNSDDTGMITGTVTAVAFGALSVTAHPVNPPTSTWGSIDYSVGGKACKSMPPALTSNDYATKGYLDNLTGAGITDITDVGTGTLNANDVLVIDSTGNAITGRPTRFYTNSLGTAPITTTNAGSYVAAFNDNANVDCSGGVITLTLPDATNREGGILSFTDVEGTIDDTHYFRLIAYTGQKIMGTILASGPDYLVADVNAHTGFSLVYVDATFGWAIIHLQR